MTRKGDCNGMAPIDSVRYRDKVRLLHRTRPKRHRLHDHGSTTATLSLRTIKDRKVVTISLRYTVWRQNLSLALRLSLCPRARSRLAVSRAQNGRYDATDCNPAVIAEEGDRTRVYTPTQMEPLIASFASSVNVSRSWSGTFKILVATRSTQAMLRPHVYLKIERYKRLQI